MWEFLLTADVLVWLWGNVNFISVRPSSAHLTSEGAAANPSWLLGGRRSSPMGWMVCEEVENPRGPNWSYWSQTSGWQVSSLELSWEPIDHRPRGTVCNCWQEALGGIDRHVSLRPNSRDESGSLTESSLSVNRPESSLSVNRPESSLSANRPESSLSVNRPESSRQQSPLWVSTDRSPLWVSTDLSPLWVSTDLSPLWVSTDRSPLWVPTDLSPLWVSTDRSLTRDSLPHAAPHSDSAVKSWSSSGSTMWTESKESKESSFKYVQQISLDLKGTVHRTTHPLTTVMEVSEVVQSTKHVWTFRGRHASFLILWCHLSVSEVMRRGLGSTDFYSSSAKFSSVSFFLFSSGFWS